MPEFKTPLYSDCAAVGQLNHVDGFDPQKYMRVIQTDDGGQGLYLDVKYRKLWFRLKHPMGKIKKLFHTLNEQVAICEARVYLSKDDGEEQYVGSGFAQRYFKPNDRMGEHYVENAETAAIGRALAEAGFGSQFSDCDISEPTDPAVVDAPVPIAEPGQPPTANVPAAAPTPVAAPTPAAPPQKPAAPQTPVPPAAPAQPKTAQTVEEIYATLTLETAKAVKVDCGYFRGQTLGQVAVNKPSSLAWYVESYHGPNNLLRAAAKFLIDKAAA